MIQLELLSAKHQETLDKLHLPPEQVQFTALPTKVLSTVAGDPNRLPVVITEDGQASGLFVLSVGEHRDKYLTQPDPYGVALSSLSVDARTQGRGIGTQAMRLLPAFVPQYFPQASHVLLVVNQRNDSAKRVYERAGFQVVGIREGPIGPQWVMSLPIHSANTREGEAT